MQASCEGQLLELEEATDFTEAEIPLQTSNGTQRKTFFGIAAAVLVAGAVALAVAWRPGEGVSSDVQSRLGVLKGALKALLRGSQGVCKWLDMALGRALKV
jgi:ferric-dicitrate binding protein FerR (iron transport regulator)